MERNNVYCEDCRYFKLIDNENPKIEKECTHENCFEPYQDFRIYDHRDFNKHNNCIFYHKKWWKIWI